MSGYNPHDNEIDTPVVTTKRSMVVGARSIKDPIHDMIPISPRLSMFIDTKQFQRLRNIKQLGTSYYVWLGASHNRFEHCIAKSKVHIAGVAFLARSMALHLQRNQPELKITDRDIECVEIAGLCHDLGHGPWSHVWDGLFIPRALPGIKWKHEDASVMMFDYLVDDNNIELTDRDKVFIKALISGEPSECIEAEKPFLFDIVANKRNGLDVDKFDYIPRDSHMIGDKMNIALMRIINSARVLDNQICYDIKDANLIYEICATRFKLHKMVYSHKAAKAIEHMIIDALLAAEPILKIAAQVTKPKEYLYLTDEIMSRIEADPRTELAPAQAIFDRIRNRDLYRMVDYKVVDWPWADIFERYMTPQKIVDAAKTLTSEDESVRRTVSTLTPEDVICDFSLMHYGMKEKNPLDFVKFYSKRHPDESRLAERGDYSNLMPNFHAELLVRIYTKTAEYFGVVQAGYRKCLAELPAQINDPKPDELVLQPLFPVAAGFTSRLPSLALSEEGSMEQTPPLPDTPVPTTPRTFSRVSSFSMGGGSMDPTLPFSNNSFTTVDPGFVPKSPSRGQKRQRVDSGLKRA
ncbi:hypothetical protein DXG01_005961 [Tephrocybe rancida]|nr:hypothetical protein DXG01_005961 [Tephrocybe rancida]